MKLQRKNVEQRKKLETGIETEPELVVPVGESLPSLSYSNEIIASLRQLVSRLNIRNNFPKNLAMVAALRQEGVSYLSLALAATVANDLGLRVCLVELNYWWPNPLFQDSDPDRTLAAVLERQTNIKDAVLTTGWPNFHILPAGVIPRHNRSKVANSDEIKDVTQELGKYYDQLILDIPALLATTDSIPLASLAPAACLVLHQGVTQMEDVSQALEEVGHLDIAGVILNRSRYATPKKMLKAIA